MLAGANILKLLQSGLKGRHYKRVAGSGGFGGVGSDPGRRLGRESELQLLQENLLIGFRLGIAWQDDVAAVGGGEMDIDHLHGLEFFKDRSRGEAGGQGAQALFEGDLEAIGDEGDKDVGFDTMVELVIDRPDGEIAFEFLEGLLDLGELDVELPQVDRIIVTEIGDAFLRVVCRRAIS